MSTICHYSRYYPYYSCSSRLGQYTQCISVPEGTGASGGHGPTMDSNAAFLQKVEEMAANALLAVAEYNALLGKAGKTFAALQVL